MKKPLFFLIIFYVITTPANANETIRHYNHNHNITGYTVLDGDKEAHFDRGWNRIGHSIHDKSDRTISYDKGYNRSGKIIWAGDTGYEFDVNGNRTGYIKKQNGKETFYNKDWKRGGHRK